MPWKAYMSICIMSVNCCPVLPETKIARQVLLKFPHITFHKSSFSSYTPADRQTNKVIWISAPHPYTQTGITSRLKYDGRKSKAVEVFRHAEAWNTAHITYVVVLINIMFWWICTVNMKCTDKLRILTPDTKTRKQVHINMAPQVLSCRVTMRKTRWPLQPIFPNLVALIFLVGQQKLAVCLHLTFNRVLAITTDTGFWAVLVVCSSNLFASEELLQRIVRNCNFYREYHRMDGYILYGRTNGSVHGAACLYHERFPHRHHANHKTFEENPGVNMRQVATELNVARMTFSRVLHRL
jgi:hypothetical protein